MSLEQQINEDLKNAMRAKDDVALRGIRAIKAAILVAKTDGSGKPVDEEMELKILQKLVKSRRESIDIFEKNGRPELAAVEKEEVAIIEKYLPKMMDEAEIEAALKTIIADLGASSLKDLGRVMGATKTAFAGKADGKLVADLVKKLLA